MKILEVTEPSNFAPNGRCYYNNPKDWKEKHDWVSDKLDDAGYACKGRSPWNSTWVKGESTIKVDYWDDFDVIKEYVGMSLLESNSVLTESYGYEKDSLIINLNKFLEDNNCPNYCHETTDGKMMCEIYQGDWKHDHLAFKYLVDAFFTNKGIKYELDRTHYEPSEGDWYTATYVIDVNKSSNVKESCEVDKTKFVVEYDFQNISKQGEPIITEHVKEIIYEESLHNAEATFNNLIDKSSNYDSAYICIARPNFLGKSLISTSSIKVYTDGKIIKDDTKSLRKSMVCEGIYGYFNYTRTGPRNKPIYSLVYGNHLIAKYDKNDWSFVLGPQWERHIDKLIEWLSDYYPGFFVKKDSADSADYYRFVPTANEAIQYIRNKNVRIIEEESRDKKYSEKKLVKEYLEDGWDYSDDELANIYGGDTEYSYDEEFELTDDEEANLG